MRLWLIPMTYIVVSVIAGFGLPRIESAYFATYTFHLSVASAQAYLSATASGMMVLTGIVFSIAFVMVQFSAVAYSPRLVLWFARDRALFHSLGIFVATFVYSLSALAWVDRGGSGTVPLFSTLLVVVLLVVSMLLFAVLVERLNALQITNVLHLVGDRGRAVIRETFRRLDDDAHPAGVAAPPDRTGFGPVTQTLMYTGDPRTIASIDVAVLVRLAREGSAVIVLTCAVGDTLVDESRLLRVHGAKAPLPERSLRRAIHLSKERTFEQDPKYPIRLLVDVAIKALSPAINDPTTAVQAIDQIEDLLRRLGRHDLDTGLARDGDGVIQVVQPMPKWEDYLSLAFDEIRQYGSDSVQVMRRLRSALVGLAESVPVEARAAEVRTYLGHLDLAIERSAFDPRDRDAARQEDRQGLGLARAAE